jgi:hypothetical protein
MSSHNSLSFSAHRSYNTHAASKTLQLHLLIINNSTPAIITTQPISAIQLIRLRPCKRGLLKKSDTLTISLSESLIRLASVTIKRYNTKLVINNVRNHIIRFHSKSALISFGISLAIFQTSQLLPLKTRYIDIASDDTIDTTTKININHSCTL